MVNESAAQDLQIDDHDAQYNIFPEEHVESVAVDTEKPDLTGEPSGVPGGGSSRPEESSINIRRAWVALGIFAAVLVVTAVLIQTHVINWSNSHTRASSSSNPYATSSIPASPNKWPYRRWSGELLLSGESSGGADLSSVPPNVNSNSGEEDVFFIDNELSGTGPIASWGGKEPPTASACALLVSTEGVGKITPQPGHSICVKTTQGDIAILVVKKNYADSSGATRATLVQATVWSK